MFRFGEFTSRSITIKNITIENFADEDNQVLKTESIAEGVVVTLDGNTYNGENLAIVLTDNIIVTPNA